MKRTDVIFAAALVLLASFVGLQAYRTGRSTIAAPVATASFGSSVDGATEDESPREVVRVAPLSRRDSVPPSATVSVAETRRRLAESASGTYVHDVLLAHDSSLTRWPDRRGMPLRVWIESSPHLTHWNPDNVALVREAFISWTEAGVPLNFTFVLDSVGADVRVTWIDRFNKQISGKTLWTHDERWWIVNADILLALHHLSGETLDAASIRAISLHEVGHLVGLDHTADSTSIMSPHVRTRDLSPSDGATVRLVYSLPPGSVRPPRRLPVQQDR